MSTACNSILHPWLLPPPPSSFSGPGASLIRRTLGPARGPRYLAGRTPRRPAAFGWEYSGGGLVDENMIVLRKRIHEMKMAEANYEAPAEWADWEKRYYASYHADVCDLLCLIQAVLVRTRPALAIGLATALAASVPISAFLLSFHLLQAARAILAGMHLL